MKQFARVLVCCACCALLGCPADRRSTVVLIERVTNVQTGEQGARVVTREDGGSQQDAWYSDASGLNCAGVKVGDELIERGGRIYLVTRIELEAEQR